MSADLTIAVVGLGFGEHFVPVYGAHPEVGRVVLVELDAQQRDRVGDRYGITDRLADLDQALADDTIDAIHVLTPVRFHAEHVIAVLEAGKHCACAVPMATTLEDLAAIIDAQRRTGRHYMMMETSAYTREFLTVQQLYRDGDLGDLAWYRGFHVQNLEGFATHWQGFPPMHYATHALSPILALTGSRVERVRCLGSGHLDDHHHAGGFDNPFPTEIALFELADSDIVADVTMSFFRTARDYREGFDLYAERMSLEWPANEDGSLRGHRLGPARPTPRGRPMEVADVPTRAFPERLPEPLRRHTQQVVVEPADGGEPFRMPAEHGGSHPHLVHEFVSSIVEDRAPAVAAVVAARWTAPGIVAHASALAGGTTMEVPDHGA